MLRPGSVFWLVRHELRLHWRKSRLGKWKTPAVLMLAIGLLLLHLPAIAVARYLGEFPLPVSDMLVAASLLLAFSFVLMLSQGLKNSVESLYERSDLDWLVTTPIPLRRVLIARMLGIAVSVVWPWLVFVGPWANGLATTGRTELMALYPVLICAALLATSIGATCTIVFTSWIGLRRTRAIATALSMITAGTAFLASQAQNVLTPATRIGLWRAIRPLCCDMPSGIQWWPGRALIGDPLPLAAVMLVGLMILMAAGWFLERRFMASAMASAATTRSGARRSDAHGTPVFAGNKRSIMIRKELRLLIRAPGMIGKAAYQLVYLVPLAVVVYRGTGEAVIAALATLPVFFMGELSRLFMTTAISTDAAFELAQTAPVSIRSVRSAKVVATCLGLATIGGFPLLAVGALVPRLIPAMAAGVVCVSLSEILLGLWKAPPARRQDLGGHHEGFNITGVLGTMISVCWSSATWLALNLNPWAALPAAVATGLLGIARL